MSIETQIPEAWQLETGLREDAVFTVCSAYFATTALYQDGKVTLLNLIGFDENGDEMTEKLSVGGDWISTDGGKTIVHPTKKRPNKSSLYGRWIEDCLAIPELANILFTRGDPSMASIWNTLVIHVKQKTLFFGKDRSGEPINRSRLMPAEFMGLAQDTLAPRGAPIQNQNQVLTGPAPSATLQSATPVNPAVLAARQAQMQAQQSPVSPLYQRVLELARSFSTHDDFMASAFQTDEILADDDLANRVADSSEIWAEAHR